jgi:WD40 repeat protein
VADVFVSYSRRDGEFVRRLVDALGERGKEAWVDVEGIRDAEVFPERLRSAIEESDGFLFVISPDAVASEYCEQEVEHALELNKRIVPLLLRQVADSDVPEGIRVRNWIPIGADGAFEPGVTRVVEALDTDLEWTKAHTRWLLKALEWDAEGREKSFLLRGSELSAAEAWLAQEAAKEPEPTGLQREYVAASRVAASKRQRRLLGVAAGVVAVSLGLLVFALISRNQAIGARNAARSQALAAESQTQLAVDPERSILLAVAAMHQKVTPQATFALRAAIDASPIRYRLPDAGQQTCGDQGFIAPGVAFAPGGHTLAEGLCNGVLVLADARSGRVVHRVKVGTDPISGPVAFSPDGRYLAACCRFGHVMLVDPATGAFRKSGPETDFGSLVYAFDPKAPLLAAAGRGDVVLWDYVTGRSRTLRFSSPQNGPPLISLAFSPDGRYLAGSAEQSVPTSPGLAVYDLRAGRRVAISAIGSGPVAFSPDGRSLAVAMFTPNVSAGRTVILDSRTLRLRRTLLSVQFVQPTAVAFSPDGSAVAYGYADGTAGLVSAENGSRIASYVGQTAAVDSVSFSPDGRFVATASVDGTTRIWRGSGGEERVLDAGGAQGGVQSAAATKNGFAAIVARPRRFGQEFVLERWAGPDYRPRPPVNLARVKSCGCTSVFMSADGRLAAAAPGTPGQQLTTLRVWSTVSGRLLRRVANFPKPSGAAVFSPDDSLVAMAFEPAPDAPPNGQQVGFVSIRTGKQKTLGSTFCGGGWRSYAFSADEKLLATGDFCGRVEVWNVATGHRVGRPFTIGGELAMIAFAPTGSRLAVAGWNGVVTVADARTGRVVAQLTGDTSGVPSVAYSPNGRYLASVSLDESARIYDANTLQALRVWEHPDPAIVVGFSPDSRQVTTADTDNVIRIWDACSACENPKALLALAATRVTRSLTPQERRNFGVGGS